MNGGLIKDTGENHNAAIGEIIKFLLYHLHTTATLDAILEMSQHRNPKLKGSFIIFIDGGEVGEFNHFGRQILKI